MANVIGEALFDIRAGTGGFLSDIAGAVGKAEDMFSNMGSSMSSKMQGAGGIMTAGLTAPIIAIGAFSIESAAKVDGAMNSMIRKTGESGVAADKTKQSFKNVFGTVPEDAGKVADAMATVKTRLGLTGTDLEGVTKKGIELARMMGTDVNTTIEGSAKVFEAWHTPANQMSGDMDKLYAISTKTGAPITDLTGALSKVGAVASSAGVPMDSVTAAVGSLAAGGIPARQGVSIITEAITKMQDAGMDAGTEMPAMLKRIADGHATDADKALLGTKNYDKLSGSLKDTKNGYDALLTAQKNSSGAIDKQAEDTMTFSDKLKIFKNDLMLAFEPLGKVLINVFSNVLKTVQPILPVITGIFRAFSNLPGPVQVILVALAGVLAALGPILMILPTLAAGFGIISGLLSGPMLAGAIAFIAPFLPFIIIAIAIGAALYLLYTYFKPFHDAVDEVVGWVKTLLGDLMSGDFGKLGEDFKNGILAGFNALLSFDWGGLLNTIVSALSGLGAAILNFILNIDWGALGNAIWTAIKSWLNPKFLKLLTDQLVTIGSFIFDKIKTGLAGLGKWFQDLLSGFGQWVWNGFMVYFNFSAKLRAEFVNLLNNFGQWVWDGLITAFNFMTKLRTEFVNLLMGFGQWVWDGLVTAFNFYVKFGTELANTLLSFGSWVWAGIGTLWEDLKAGFKTVADDFGGAINNILHPPTATPAQETQDAASLQNKSVLQTVFGLSTGGVVRSRPGGVPVILGEGQDDEYVIPASKMGHGGIIGGGLVSAFGSPGGKTSQSGDTHFHVQFNNATLTSVDDADKLGRRMAYTANEYLRRSGHSRG